VHGGAGADALHVQPTSSDPQIIEPAQASWEVDPVLGLNATLSMHILPWLSLDVGASLDIDLVNTRFVAARSADHVAVLDPWTLRPSASLGITWSEAP
jgi:hypothetical protein